MIYNSSGDIVDQTGANFFCIALPCNATENGRYQGLLDGGQKVVWLSGCNTCGGVLVMDNVDQENPLKSLVRQVLLNAAAHPAGFGEANTILWSVVAEFISVSRDMMKVNSENLISQTVSSSSPPFVFMGYLAKLWLPLIVPTTVSARAVNSLKVEYSELGILLNYQDIRIGIFEKLTTAEIYSAAYYIEKEINRHQKRIDEPSDEICDAMEISVSGLIGYLDRMLFELGNPLDEIHTILTLLATLYLESAPDKKQELMLRKAVGILWLFKDACCEVEPVKDLFIPKRSMSMQ